MLSLAVARSRADDSAIRYVRTSVFVDDARLPIVGHMTRD